MHAIRLIHWDEEEAAACADRLRAAGYSVERFLPEDPWTKSLDASPPAAIVIDLSRLPSHGRDMAMALRERKSTRRIPLVFVGGAPDKVARIRASLPDATFTTWARVRGSLRSAIAKPPKAPAAPPSRLAGYSGTPLPRKLGIKEGSTAGLIGAPSGFGTTLGNLPPRARLVRTPRTPCDLLVWFVTTEKDLRAGIDRAKSLFKGGLWIAWPKQASGVKTDIKEQTVRDLGLANGLVDYKVCAIDRTWSGLKFAVRAR